MQKPRLAHVLMVLCVLLAVPAVCAAAEKEQPGDALARLLEKDYKPEEPLIPAGVRKEPAYREGAQAQVGIIEFVENEAYVIHSEEPNVAYRAVKSKAVSLGDTVVCEEKSRLMVLLKDQSQLSFAAHTKATLDKVNFDQATGERDSAVKMASGAARYVVSKTAAGDKAKFQVETPLAVVGVRGSDFAVGIVPEAAVPRNMRQSLLERIFGVREAFAQARGGGPQSTVVLTGPNTTLSFQAMVGPPVVISSFQSSVAVTGRPPTPPLQVTPNLTPNIMNRVGPSVSIMSMPEAFE
jgi:hypothetical protein